MSACEFADAPDIELYFYEDLADAPRARVAAHVEACAACRQRLDDLHAIRRALADAPVVDTPPAGDWSGFMRRLDRSTEGLRPSDSPARSLARRFAGSLPRPPRLRRDPAEALRAKAGRSRGSLTAFARVAATLAVVAAGVFMAARIRSAHPASVVYNVPAPSTAGSIGPSSAASARAISAKGDQALREVSAEHLERSKLVVLGLAARNAQQTRAADWQFERQLAGSLLPETRLYRLTAQERGVADVARVMRDLETVLLEASMSDGRDRASLERVQRLISRRGLVSKMQIVTTSAGL